MMRGGMKLVKKLFDSTWARFQEHVMRYFLHLLYRMKDARQPMGLDASHLSSMLIQNLLGSKPLVQAPGQLMVTVAMVLVEHCCLQATN